MRMLFICLILMITGMRPVAARTITTATLKVVLEVPPAPITCSTAEGFHEDGCYRVRKTEDTIYVTAEG